MASAISADESFEQAITIALRGDENTDNGLSSRVNLFVSHRRPAPAVPRTENHQLRSLSNCPGPTGKRGRRPQLHRAGLLAETTVAPLRIANYGKNRLLAAGSSERAPHCNICCGSMSPQEDQWLSAAGSNHPATKHRNLK